MPRNRGARERVATGVFRDAHGFSIIAKVGGDQEERRHPHGTSLDKLRTLRAALVTEMSRRHGRAVPAKGTLAAAAREYLPAVKAMPSYKSRRRQIELWVEVFGRRPLSKLTHVEIAQQLQRWLSEPRDADDEKSAPYSVQYVLHLHTALSHLFTTLYPDAPNPLERVARPSPPEAEPRAIPVFAFVTILKAYPLRSKTKARQAVMAATGLGHTELMRVKPTDVHLEPRLDRSRPFQGIVTARARRKGKGSAPRTIPLTPHAWRAWRLFVRVNAFGTFSTSNMRRDFRLAAAAAGFVLRDAAHPDGLDWRPYDSRHTFGTELGRHGKDERAVQEILGHADIRTTRRYTQGSVSPRVAAAIGALGASRRGQP